MGQLTHRNAPLTRSRGSHHDSHDLFGGDDGGDLFGDFFAAFYGDNACNDQSLQF